MHRRPPVPLRTGALIGLALSSLLLAGCSQSGSAAPAGGPPADPTVSDASDAGSGGDTDDLRDAQLESGVPAECLDAFPAAFGGADLSDATLLPADFPVEAVAGTLCQTAATGEGLQTVDWATDASGTEVLDALAAALPASYDVTREDKGLGEQLDGTDGDVSFTVLTRPGAWTLQLAPA